MILVCLGRHGDIVNCIPIAYALSRSLGRVNWLVGKDCEGTLEGCSYINPVRWEGGQDTLPDAIRNYSNAGPIVAQAWRNPDSRRLTSSYALEQWRLAGRLNEFNSWPLIFDRTNESRANMLRDRTLSFRERGRPLIIVCVDGVSSPFTLGPRLLAMLRGLDADVLDLRDVRAEQVFDLLPLFDAADCLVTIDTLPLHLARATSVPTVCLLNDQWNGWRASVPPPQCLWSQTYSQSEKDLQAVVDNVSAIISRPACRSIQVVAQIHGHTERHLRARATWPDNAMQLEFDHRPQIKEVLAPALDSDADVIVHSNDDVAFLQGSLDRIRAHASRWDFGCARRSPDHIGREVYWFRRDWLAEHFDSMPNPYLTVQKPDLILAAWMRSMRGIKTTLDNLALDFPPIELPAGIVFHEEHESSWLGEPERSKEGQFNEELWRSLLNVA